MLVLSLDANIVLVFRYDPEVTVSDIKETRFAFMEMLFRKSHF